jgi:phosphoacetylglucosamine mutase
MIDISEKIGTAVAMVSSYHNNKYGIMITASHNPHYYNGVKIIDSNGEMIPEIEEKTIEEFVNSKNSCVEDKNMSLPEIYIGYDTRESSPEICNLIIKGIKIYNKDSIIHNLKLVSTPELHFKLFNEDLIYIEYLKNLCEKINYPVVCDCANGVGGYILNKLNYNFLQTSNTNCINYESLNFKSGSDYVVTEREIPTYFNNNHNKLHASLDGDADRIVFYYKNNDSINLLNGDKISALIAYYISKKVENLENIAVIHTGYSNNSFVNFINKLGIKTICTATGVKNLHSEALNHDISIYFESNGHGTVLFNKSYENLKDLEQFFHPTIGDGIMDMFGILFILQETSITMYEWDNMYTDNPYHLLKMKVFDKSCFETTKNELRLTKPEDFQQYIDTVCDEKTRCFVRPSGTEDNIRIYVEGNDINAVNNIVMLMESWVSSNYIKETFTKNDKLFIVDDLKKEDYDYKLYPSYLDLLSQLTIINPKNINREDFNNFIDNLNQNHFIKVIKYKYTNQIVGSITVLKETKLIHDFGKVGHIEDVVVDKALRGYGLGKKLVDIAVKECQDCYKIILDCNDENVEFYKKCGFEWKGNQLALYKK